MIAQAEGKPGFSFIFSLTSSALDHSSTAPPDFESILTSLYLVN